MVIVPQAGGVTDDVEVDGVKLALERFWVLGCWIDPLQSNNSFTNRFLRWPYPIKSLPRCRPNMTAFVN